jgi:hypothetical protein
VAAELRSLLDLADPVVVLGVALFGRFVLTALMAITAVFAKDPTRQARALEVLRTLRPPWRQQSRDADPRAPD